VNPSEPTARFAIVGAGPKGTYALERLCAKIATSESRRRVKIDVFESSGKFGSGHIYGPENPDYLLLNYSSENVDMWRKENRNGSGARFTSTLIDWLKLTKYPKSHPDDFVPRNVVGRYLSEGFDHLLESAPRNVRIEKFPVEITAAEIDENGKVMLRSDSHDLSGEVRYDRVLLSTGHQMRAESKTLFGSDREIGSAREICSVFPIEHLNQIDSGSVLAVRGMGLTFIDSVIALTEGRGGTFARNEEGNLVYRRSGEEPNRILPYSRSGTLMTPRGPSSHNTLPDSIRYILNEVSETATAGEIDFDLSIFPLLRAVYAKIPNSGPGYIVREHPRGQHIQTVAKLRDQIGAIKTLHPSANRAWIWSSIVPEIRKLYQFGGFTPGSHRRFDEHWIGLLGLLSFGPPLENAEKILALANNGILEFHFSCEPTVTSNHTGFTLTKGDARTDADFHLNATIPRNKEILSNLSPLYRNLLDSGLGRLFNNGDYRPGCLDIDKQGRVLTSNGAPTPIHLYGTPTEGILFDNDTLSRNANDLSKPFAEACSETLLHKALI